MSHSTAINKASQHLNWRPNRSQRVSVGQLISRSNGGTAMITHVPTPFDRLMERLAARFGAWLDTLCVEQTEARAGGVPAGAAAPPPTKGLPAVLRALEQRADGSVRQLARDLGSSKSTVQRANRKMLAYA